ncbi:MAG: SufE family protein [Opitutales bacterium]|nr:SufE family protein [Opitutales bacterium]MCH8541900.1 SufE family protein [Opitutales bacterium]
MPIREKEEQLLAAMEVLPTAEDKLSWLVERGQRVPGLRAEEKTEAHRIVGCQSPVWVVGTVSAEETFSWRIETPSAMVRGLVGVLWELYEEATCREIQETEIVFWSRSGLERVLSPTRRQGLVAVQARIQAMVAEDRNG